MTNDYKELFLAIAQSSELIAEQVMDYNHRKNDDNGEKTAQSMRDDYQSLADKIMDEKSLTKDDYRKLLLGAMVIKNNLQAKIKQEETVFNTYSLSIIPRLQRVLDEPKTIDELEKLSNELFSSSI